MLSGCAVGAEPITLDPATDAGVAALEVRASAVDEDAGVDPCGRADAGLGPLAALCTHPLVRGLRELPVWSPTPFLRGFTFRVVEPIDHADPSRGSFGLRVQLVHRDASLPTALEINGYKLPETDLLLENQIGNLILGNSVAVEHRFFGPSTPLLTAERALPPDAWRYLSIAQSAADTHRVVEVLRSVYRGKWLSTGGSKGGIEAVVHRRFYPDDVQGTFVTAAPYSAGLDDPRIPAFFQRAGTAQCREKLRAVQRAFLTRREELLPALRTWTRDMGMTFEHVGSLDVAYEHAVLTYRWIFYQWGTAEDCDLIPAPHAPAKALTDELLTFGSFDGASDRSVASLDVVAAYWYQAATELGDGGPLDDGLRDLLRYPGTYGAAQYAPVAGLRFDPEPMRDVQRWLLAHGDRFIFMYGDRDPWAALPFATPPGREVYNLIVPGANHMTRLGSELMSTRIFRRVRTTLVHWVGGFIPGESEGLGGDVTAMARLRAPTAPP